MDAENKNPEGEGQEEEKNPISGIEFLLMALLAASNDFSDFIFEPLKAAALVLLPPLAVFLQFAGDAWDIGTGFFLCLWLWMKGAKVRWKFAPGVATGVELFPGADAITSFLVSVLAVYIMSSPRIKKLLQAALKTMAPQGRAAQILSRAIGAATTKT